MISSKHPVISTDISSHHLVTIGEVRTINNLHSDLVFDIDRERGMHLEYKLVQVASITI